MLTTILRQVQAQAPLPTQAATVPEVPEPDAAEKTQALQPADYELVMGRGQIASVLFVATVVLVVFSAISYLTGKSSAARKAPTAAEPQIAILEKPPVAEATLAAPPTFPIVPPVPVVAPEPGQEAPLFADPAKGAVFLQMGAVEQGIAVIFVEGLRKRGFQAFAAPGPNEKIFRVLIGPIPDSKTFVRTKEAVDQIGLATFARKYQQ